MDENDLITTLTSVDQTIYPYFATSTSSIISNTSVDRDTRYIRSVAAERFFKWVISSSTEDEVRTIMDKIRPAIISYEGGSSEWESLLAEIIRERHFSEEFLLDCAAYFSNKKLFRDSIMDKHMADIHSKAYPSLALMLEVK